MQPGLRIHVRQLVSIVLAARALAEGSDELRGDDARLQAMFLATPCPMMRAAARLHRHHRPATQNRCFAKSAPMVIVLMETPFSADGCVVTPSRPLRPQGEEASFYSFKPKPLRGSA